MAITVNGFGAGSGGGGGRRGVYYMRLINAGSSVLSGMTATNNPAPPVSSMQELLNIDGSGRLLLLAAYGNARAKNKHQFYDNAEDIERTSGFARVRIAADDRVIYKACVMVRATSPSSVDGYAVTGDHIPPLIEDPSFSYGLSIGNNGNSRSSNTLSYQFRHSDCPFLPGQPGTGYETKRIVTIDELIDYGSTSESARAVPRSVPASYYFHTPNDDGAKTSPDYCCSIFPGGLYFDGNLTIHAAYGLAPIAASPNGILVIYELFDE